MTKKRIVTAFLLLAGVLLAATTQAQAPQLLQRELNPVPGQGEEKGSRPFMWVQMHAQGGVPYLIAGRGNTFDTWNVTNPLSPDLTNSNVGRPTGLVELGDLDFHLRSVAMLDGEGEMYGAYFNLGSYAFTLNPTSPSPTVTAKAYPITQPDGSLFITGVASFREAAGTRYLVGRYLLEDGYQNGLYATGIYDFSNPTAITRVRSLPFRRDQNDTSCPGCPIDAAALQSQGVMSFKFGTTPFLAVPAGSPAGGLHLLDVSSIQSIGWQAVNPPIGYNALVGKAYDPSRNLLALAFTGTGQPPLVVVYEMRSVIGTIAPVEIVRGSLPGLSAIAGVGIGAGVVAVSGVVAGAVPATRTTYLAALDGVTGSVIWKTDPVLDLPSAYSEGGSTYQVFLTGHQVLDGGATDLLLYRGGFDLAEWWRVPKGFVDPAPHAGFSVTSSSTGATCGTTPTSPSTAIAGQAFPGATVSITNQSSGVVTSSTLRIARVTPSPAVIYGPAAFALGATYTWSTGAAAVPGEYHVTVTAEDSASGKSSTLVKSLFLCNESAALTAPTSTSVLLAENLLADAGGSQGSPSSFDFVVVPPGGQPQYTPVGFVPGTRTITFSQCGAYTVGVVAHYSHPGTDACAGRSWYTDSNPSTYDACAEWPIITSGLSAVAFSVRQGSTTLASAPAQASVSAVRSADTVLDAAATRVAAGYTASYQWQIGGAPACQSPYKPATGCVDTQATYTIPANTMSVGTAVNVALQVTLAGPGVSGCNLSPAPVPITINPAEVTADITAVPSTVNVGQAVTFTLTNVSGSFSSLSLDLGGATSCAGQTTVALCSGAQCVTGRQVQVAFQTPGTWQVRVVGTPTLGGSFSGPTHPVTINSTGNCTQTLPIFASPNPANAGSVVTISFSPSVASGSDQLTINFGDGTSQTLTGALCGLLGGCSGATHTYGTANTYTINASGTIGGLNYVGSTTVTVSGTVQPPTGTVTMSAAPNPVDQGVATTITFSPSLNLSGDTLTFNWGAGQTTTLSYPSCSGTIFGGGGPCSTLTHVFQSPGTWTVTASGTIGGVSRTGSTQVTVRSLCALPSAPAAEFAWAPSVGKVNQPVQFTNASTGGPTSWAWDFGDGMPPLLPAGSSIAQSPAYTFTREGTFTVKLTATNCRGSSQITHPVTVGPECDLTEAPTASFKVETAEPRAKQPVQFTDQSTGTIESWLWEFGDGQTSSQASPTHVFQQPGPFTVKLTVSNCKGSTSVEQQVNVGEDNRPVTADFTWEPAAITTGDEITFSALTGYDYGDPDAFTWQFSDETGTRSDPEVTRTFACSGTVQVTLTALRGIYSDTETKAIAIDGERCAPEAVVTTDAAKTAGANGTYWQTDLWVFNPSVQSTQVWLAVLVSGGDNAAPLTSGPYTVGPRATLYLHNVLEELSQQTGQDYRKGSIRLTFENGEDMAPVATARTFTPSPTLPGGNYGQSVRGVPVWPNSTAPVQWLTGLRNDGIASGFRTNFGLANLRGDRSADPVVVTLFGSSGSQLGQTTFGLPPYGYIQDSVANLFGAGTSTIGPFSLKIEVGKQADVEISASVVENLTGDPMQVVATVPQQTRLCLPAIARAAGANNTVWRSSLQLTNPHDQPHTWRLTYQPRGEALAGVTRERTLASGQTFAIEDVVAWIFEAFGVSPPEQTAGVVTITPSPGSNELPVAIARTYNVTVQGTFGHAIPALHASMGASAGSGSTHLVLPGLSSEDVARTNLGFVNLDEAGAVNFDVYFFAEDGTLLNPEGRPYVLALPPGGWDQDRIENRFRGFFGADLPANQRALSVAIEVRGGTAGFAYASVVDNVTGDPIWISGQLLP